jgi:hypothetical protein
MQHRKQKRPLSPIAADPLNVSLTALCVPRALQQAALELNRSKITDSLKKGLEHRPERDALVERNILPDSNAAPALQAHQRELEKHMRRDSLEKKLSDRPKPEDLIREGILEGEFVRA